MRIALFLIACTFTLLLTSCGTDTVPADAKVDHQVAAIDIFTDFKTNEVAAKEKFGGKVLAVRGIVAKIDALGDGGSVVLNDGNPENTGVICHFNADQSKEIAALKPGDAVKVIGIGASSLTIDYYLSGCRLGKLGE